MNTTNMPTMMMKNLAAMDMDSVRRTAPAVFGYAAPGLSARYEHVRTADVIERLMGHGFQVTSAKQDRPTKRDPNTVRHLVTMVHEKALSDPAAFTEGVPTLLLWNSHNGRSLLRMLGGFYRFVCSNGLIVGTTEHEFGFRHSATPLSQMNEALDLVHERQQLALTCMKEWGKIELTQPKILSFAERAAQLRFGEKAGGGYDRDEVLRARRVEDEGDNLWRVMNRAQENLIRGGVSGKSATGRKLTSRESKSLHIDLEFNRGLWQLASEYAAAA